MAQLCSFFPKSIGGQLMWAGGATALMEAGHSGSHMGCRKLVLGHLQPVHTKKCLSLWGPAHWSSVFTTDRPFPCQCFCRAHLKPIHSHWLHLSSWTTWQNTIASLLSSPLPSSYGLLAIHKLFLMPKNSESDPKLMLGLLLSPLKHQNHVQCICKHSNVN